MHLLQTSSREISSILDDCQMVLQISSVLPRHDGALNRGHKQTDVIIMDFSKAFDNVPHRRLLYKTDYYKIRGSSHKNVSAGFVART